MFMTRQTPKIKISGQQAAAGVVGNTALQPGSLDIYIMYVCMYDYIQQSVVVRWGGRWGGGNCTGCPHSQQWVNLRVLAEEHKQQHTTTPLGINQAGLQVFTAAANVHQESSSTGENV